MYGLWVFRMTKGPGEVHHFIISCLGAWFYSYCVLSVTWKPLAGVLSARLLLVLPCYLSLDIL